MPEIPPFDALSFFEQFTANGVQVGSAELQPVLEFTLLWNLFEREAHERHMSVGGLRTVVDENDNAGKLDCEAFKPHLNFFRTRYPDLDEVSALRRRLTPRDHRMGRTRGTDNLNIVKRVIKGELSDPGNVVYALLFIAYRVRNNLFHGEKDIHTLHLQEDLFRTVNSFLSIYLKQTLEERQIGG